MSERSEERTLCRRTPRAAIGAILLLLAALSLSGCGFRKFFGSKSEPTAAATTAPVSPTGDGATEGDAQSAEDRSLPRLIERAIGDLAQTTSASADEIIVVSVEEVEWSDTSLGCPAPDEMYAQMITPGYRIVLESGGAAYDYHSGTDPEGPLVQCVDGEPSEGEPQLDEDVAPLGDAQDGVQARLIERAIGDLAQTTSASADEIIVVSVEEVEWSDTSLGCPAPDEMYAQMITPGYRIVLESGGAAYDYHSGTDPEGPLVQCVDGEPSEGEPQLDEDVASLGDAQDGVQARLIERAIGDLAQTTAASADEIIVVSVEEVEWSDTSLGCPAPDEMYAQMITPGYRIVLESGGAAYDYHSGTDPEGPLVQCVDGEPSEGESQLDEDVAPLGDAQDGVQARLIERAIGDLAQTTSASADEIIVVSVEEVEWSDTSLGCPAPDEMYAQMITPGYRIVLESGGAAYDYHSGTDPEGPLVQCSTEADGEG